MTPETSALEDTLEVEDDFAGLRFASSRAVSTEPNEGQPVEDINVMPNSKQLDVLRSGNCAPVAPTTNKPLQPSPDPSVRTRLEELRHKLVKMQLHIAKEIRTGKKKIDPRDPADIQALLDYCILAEQLCREG